MKLYSLKQQLYSLFGSRESLKIVASKPSPARKDTLLYYCTSCFSPDSLKNEFMSCSDYILWVLLVKKGEIFIFVLFGENANKEDFPAECIFYKINRWILLLRGTLTLMSSYESLQIITTILEI